jgi:hypothetical protein
MIAVFLFIKNMKDEKPMDYIAFCLCRGLAEYDANEIVPTTSDTTTTSDNKGYRDSSAD